MRLALGIAATVAGIVPQKAEAKRDVCHTRVCNERVAMDRCSQNRPRWCVERAILTYRFTGWRSSWMRRIPACESGWNPYAVNGGGSGSTGLYQFMPSTWSSTPYGRRSIYSAKWQSLAAAWMLRVGRAPGEWSCR